MNETMITVFLVDDHAVVRVGIGQMLDAEPDLRVIGEASTVGEALVRIPETRPDVAVLDVRLPDGNGVELCRELRSQIPGLNCLMLTSFDDKQAMLNALLAGAGGYVIKDVRGMELASAIRTVGMGRSLLGKRSTSALVEQLRTTLGEPKQLARLTEQERALLDLIGQGLTNRQIAERMFLAEKTVKNYITQLLAKLGLARRTQAAVLATEERRRKSEE